jgi:hypothetical protein
VKQLQGMALTAKRSHQSQSLTELTVLQATEKTVNCRQNLDGVQFNLEMEASACCYLQQEMTVSQEGGEEGLEWLEAFCKTDQCLQTKDGVLTKHQMTPVRPFGVAAEQAADESLL